MARPEKLKGWPLLAASSPAQSIPFSSVIRDLHATLQAGGVTYAIIGGVAVARAGSSRTTGDIDLLLRREEWAGVLEAPLQRGAHRRFELANDGATHKPSGVSIDILFAGDDWDLPFLLPDPGDVREWDRAAEAWFIKPARLLELKAAIYLSKMNEYGASVAAKDLYDVSALIAARPELRNTAQIEQFHPSIQETVRKTVVEIERREERGPKRPK